MATVQFLGGRLWKTNLNMSDTEFWALKVMSYSISNYCNFINLILYCRVLYVLVMTDF